MIMVELIMVDVGEQWRDADDGHDGAGFIEVAIVNISSDRYGFVIVDSPFDIEHFLNPMVNDDQ